MPSSRWHETQCAYTIRETCLFQVISPIIGCADAHPPASSDVAAIEIRKRFMNRRSRWCSEGSGKITTVAAALALALTGLFAAEVRAQMPGMSSMPPPLELVFVCPFDRSHRSATAGTCERRGRNVDMVAEVPEPLEFALALTTTPARVVPGQPVRLQFQVRDPWMNKVVSKFAVVHESPFHAFIVSEDLEFFLHDHPHWTGSAFELDTVLPKSGLYRVLTDFLPEAATPQLLTRSVFAGDGSTAAAVLERDYSDKQGQNVAITMTTTPQEPVAGTTTTLRFVLSPEQGIEPYLGVLGHMLIASDDLIDLMHTHPITTQVGPVAEFAVVFPRPTVYRVWVQFQRQGVVNTVHFDVPVDPMP